MAIKPTMSPPSKPAPRFNPTAIAIAGSFGLAVVLTTILAGSPFRAIRLAYMDYSKMTPAVTVNTPPAK